ncbi:hypothetical protein BAUCODRAFT_77478 [Baudoinia panamericana UAMH 10762]|uniref:Sialidase n=1 Tax=Baudoinia panamericana (strain UAMH 10762) TaxID=717646 RepID=M2N2B9_BAUPA|nr:uncharacterized protein BAUCODRAFT_77478 [Baudoinia panamericana UAMH 10762]EMC92820.1 hypothetical protein BAUCODRAFT_77478 [Baudoinia panamericana UAMH 10762]
MDDFELRCPGGSASTVDSCFPFDWSPETVTTNATTPPKSPFKLRETGPALLPRVRCQDQVIEPAVRPSYFAHNRTTSLPANSLPLVFGEALPTYQPTIERRSASPPGHIPHAPPFASPSPYGLLMNDRASAHVRPSLANMRSVSASNIGMHSRNNSSSNIDAAMLSRYGYPTYRQSPTPQPATYSVPMSRTPSAMSHLAPIALPSGHVQSYPQRKRTASPPANPSRLSVEVEYSPAMDLETSSLLDYLTAPNPTPSLTQRTVGLARDHPYFWFDVRNVQRWADFNVSTIAAQPSLLDLLHMPVTLRQLTQPRKVTTSPETVPQLAEACALHHAVKVNAALKVTQGDKHMAMRTLQCAPGSRREQPEFVSSYQSDKEKTIYRDGRGRVVGIVQSHDQWNSGLRSGDATDKVRYQQTLAKLHYFMRDHGTRYGFIITEIELVCIRIGGPLTEAKPLFGMMEIATPVEIATSGLREDGTLKMTAGLALWWLHMLARDQPFEGQHHWKLDVGPPGALSRQHHLPKRDEWMPKLSQKEKRAAKRIRGWVLPDEPLSKREQGKVRRGKAV